MFKAIIKAFVSRLKGAGCLISIFAFLQFELTGNIVASDYFPGKEWRTATPESQGMSSEVLTKMLDYIWQKNYAIDSITIVRNGYMVLDAYNRSNKPQHKHILYSCSKSVISALIGIAIDKGSIKSVDQPILSFFPERTAENLDQRKKNMTLKHVLMMATGLRCQDSYLYGWVGLYEMRNKSDWVNPMPALPIIHGRSSVEGIRSFMVAIAEIPSAIKLEYSADFFIYGIKNELKIEAVNIQHKELIKLSDGTEANYFELDWHYQRTDLVTSGVVVYRNGKLISILSTGSKYGSIEDLKQMSTSLVFK